MTLKIYLPFACLLFIFSPLTLFAQQGPGGGGYGGGNRGNGLIEVASGVSQGRIVTLGGRTTPLRKITHSVSVAGYVDRILVKVGDRVQEGQALMRFSRDAVGETFRPVVLESRLKGVVSEISVNEKEEVKAGTVALTILDDTSLTLNTSLSDRDAQALRALGPTNVIGKTPEGASFQGQILQISAEPDYTTGLFTLTMEFPKQPGLFLGMILFVDLAAEKPSGIGVKKDAVLRLGGQTYLWVLDKDNKFTQRAITLGAPQGDKISVTTGLDSGERYAGKLTGKEKEGMTMREYLQATLGGTSGTPPQRAESAPAKGAN